MLKNTVLASLALVFLVAASATAGQLQIGSPTFSDDEVTLPISLNHTTTPGVASLSFELSFDPDVLEFDEASVGAVAASAGKDVQTSLPEPGRLIVVVLGLNTNTIGNGVVTDITLGVLDPPASLRSTVVVEETVFAPSDGSMELPSQGDTRFVEFQAQNLIELFWSFIVRVFEFFQALFGALLGAA
jgi:cohesin domain-containing protein